MLIGHFDITSISGIPAYRNTYLIKEKSIEIWGDGSEKREFIWVDDLGFLCKEIFNNKITGIVNTVSGKSYSYMEIIHELNKILDKTIQNNMDLVKERGEYAVVTLMGIVMKEVRGKASGKMVNDLLRKKVSEL